MSETFSILIDNRSRAETEQSGGLWLSMPTTTEQLHAAMESVGISAQNPQDFFINGFSDTEDIPFDVPLDVIRQSSIDELNYLGKQLEFLHDDDRDKFTAAVTHGEYAGSVKDLINLAQNLDCYWIYPTVRNEKDYGCYLIDELDELELPEEAKKYFMYEEYGHDAVINDGGKFTEQGYIYNNKNTFTEWYDGRDVPEKYRVMSYPKPPTLSDLSMVEPDAPPSATEQTATQTQESSQPIPVKPIVLTAEKPADKMKEITDRLEQGIKELFESERFKEYLRVMSKFHNYSFNNTLLIAMQKPDASLVAGFSAWKNTFKRNVIKGEKGIRILATSPFKIKQEVEKIDPQTQKPVIDADGKPVTETKEVTIPAFKVVSVFDVSQTEGKELPDIAVDTLTGDVEQYKDFFAALEKTSPASIGFENIEGGTHGYYHLEEKRIAINEDMSELQTLKTAIHEISHAKLHDIDLNAPTEERQVRPDRRTREVEAESVAYTVCQHYGLDTSDYSFGYIAGWSNGRELTELKSSLETIRSTVAEIINSIDAQLAEIQKTQDKEQNNERDTPQPESPSAQSTVSQPNKPENVQKSEPEQDTPKAENLTDLQKKAIETAKRYEKLPTQDKIDIIAQAFDCTTGKIETSPCSGKWRGTSDISIKFDNGKSLFIGNHSTPKSKTAKVQNECINNALVQYNPEIINAAKEAAVTALRKRETQDNAVAAQKGLKPYTILNVEFNDGTDDKSGGYMGRYYVTLAVDGKIRAHIETGLNHDITDGKVSETPSNKRYFAAGALKESDIDYIFNNVGFSSTSELYSLHIGDDVRERAKKTLAEREKAQHAVEAPAPDKMPGQTEPRTSVTYYPINETAAQRAKEAISYSDYKPGSATAEYRHYVDEAAELAARQKKRVDPSFHAKIDSMLDTYARKLAANMNKGYEITARVPSVLITGGSNFPVRKKEKQNAAADKNMEEYREIQGLLDKIRSTGMGGISADDPNAVSKLESKLAKLEKSQETMKAVNTYYRKNKTLDGCPALNPEQIENLKADMAQSWHIDPKPFASRALSNNNAEIRRVKERIASLTRQKEVGYVGWEFDGGKAEANAADNLLQIFFDGKPDPDIRAELKGNGFKWSPSAGAWQRQLNDNAIYAADRIKSIQPLTGERPTELQRRTRHEAQEAAQTAEHDKDTFTIYQIKGGDEMRNYIFEPYDRLQTAGLKVDPANYEAVYAAPLAPDMSLEDIYTRFNIDHPKDFTGHSLSVSDVVVLHRNEQDTAHYVDSFGYKDIPEFLQEQNPLIPDELMTGEKVTTPRGTFYLTAMSREQMEAAGYGFHHQSDDEKYLIMGNGTRAFAIAAKQPENYLKTAEQSTEQNANMLDGQINNTPTVNELESRAKSGEQISLVDLAEALKTEKQHSRDKEEKPSIRAQLKADKEKSAQKKTAAKTKNNDLEV